MSSTHEWLKLSEKGNNRYRKELFRIDVPYEKTSDGISFEFDEDYAKHAVDTFSQMRADGVKVPIPMGHSETDENNNGWVHDITFDGKSVFADMEVNGVPEENLRNYDVSVFIPPKYTAGGKTYQRPIRHVALTAYPVIPGLDAWEAISASFTTVEKEKPMPIDFKKLGADLGIESEMSEENAPELLASAFSTLQDELKKVKKLAEKSTEKPDEKPKTPVEELKAIAASAPGILKIAKEGREAKIDTLLQCSQPKINKIVRDGLVNIFCTDENIALSLSEAETDFDKLIELLKQNEVISTGEKTGPQTLQLSDPMKKPATNPLLADAQRRAEAAKAS